MKSSQMPEEAYEKKQRRCFNILEVKNEILSNQSRMNSLFQCKWQPFPWKKKNSEK